MRVGAGVVDEHVESAEGLDRAGHQARDVLFTAEVARDGDGSPAPGGDLQDQRGRLVGPMTVVGDDGRPRLREARGNAVTEASARAGDESHLSRKSSSEATRGVSMSSGAAAS